MRLPERVVRRYLATIEVKVIDFARVKKPGAEFELFLVERDDVFYVLSYETMGNLSFGIESRSSSRSRAKSDFDRILDKNVKGVQLMGTSYGEVVDTRMDAEAQQHLKVFSHPLFGVDWSKGSELESPEVDFLKYLEQQIRDWKGSPVTLSVAQHEYWPEFRKMVQEAVRKKYGSSFELYRGIYRDQAKEILDNPGQPLEVRPYSSWADSLAGAKSYRGDRFDAWVVVKAKFSAGDIALAPVELPDFIKPDILVRFAHDVQSVGDELVVGPRRAVDRYTVVLRTKKKLGVEQGHDRGSGRRYPV